MTQVIGKYESKKKKREISRTHSEALKNGLLHLTLRLFLNYS